MPQRSLLQHTCLGLTLVLALAACGGGSTVGNTPGQPGNPGTPNPPSGEQPKPNPPKKQPDPTPPGPTPLPPPPPPPDESKEKQPQVTNVLFTSEETQVASKANASNVARDVAVTANIYLPQPGVGVNSGTLGGVKLYEDATKAGVAGTAGTDGAGGNITFALNEGVVLKANTKYTFEVTSGVKDEAGTPFVPFKASFTTGTRLPKGPVALFNDEVAQDNLPLVASLRVAQDGAHLYASTLDGKILRWTIQTDGKLTGLQTYNSKLVDAGRPRAFVGLTQDPRDPNVWWVTNNAPIPYGPDTNTPDFSGKISKITFDGNPNALNGTLQDYVVGLPRSIKDHLTNSVAFGPDGFLYVTQGSNSSTGAPDGTWVRAEHRLNAAVLQVDPNYDVSLGPIDVQTEVYPGSSSPGTYDPNGLGAPVTVYADGVRNSYDLVWHSNGSLYLPTNGGAAGGSTPPSPEGYAPRVPALTNVSNQEDYLFKVDGPGGYYGHPVALRGHYVLNGGNPTAGVDPQEVVPDGQNHNGYPVGTQPDPNYRRPAYEFGANRSPNGALEYKSGSFGGKLKNNLLVVEYANGNDILALPLNPDGSVNGEAAGRLGTASGKIKRFDDPIDLAEDGRNGNLYVAEMVYGKGRITLLRPTQ